MRAIGLLEDRGEALAQLGVVALARHIDEGRDEPPEGIAAHEQRDALALLQAQDAQRDVEQLVLGDLEQLVARKGLEDVHQRLAVMARGLEAGAREGALDLAAQQRDRARALGIGGRGEEADEQPLARRLSVGAEFPHRDRVHVHRAVDRRRGGSTW